MAWKNKPYFVVTGMHRSGTTLTGRILSCYPGLHVIHEPLNKDYGLSGVDHVYPCDMNLEQEGYYLTLLDRLLEGKAGFVRRAPTDSLTKALARAVIGGNTGLDMIKFRLRRLISSSLTPVIKDPFATLLSRSLLDKGNRIIAIVRHPAAIWRSVERMKWSFSYADFAYTGVFSDLALTPPSGIMDALPEIEKFAWLWTAIYTYLDRLAGNEHLLVVRHEDLCLKPYDEVQRLEAFLGLAPSRSAHDFIVKNMFAETVTATGKQLHIFERDSRKLSTSWYGRLGADDESILKGICGPVVERYYGRWTPV